MRLVSNFEIGSPLSFSISFFFIVKKDMGNVRNIFRFVKSFFQKIKKNMTRKEKLVKYLEKHNLSQTDLGKLLGIKRQDVNYHFSKKKDLSLDFYSRAIEVLRVRERELTKVNLGELIIDETNRVGDTITQSSSDKYVQCLERLNVVLEENAVLKSRIKELEDEIQNQRGKT